MTAARRTGYNFALQRAVGLAGELGRPLLVFEPLRAGYEHASERFHSFIIQGMENQQAELETGPVGYWPYIEPKAGQGQGLLAALAEKACAVVTDYLPCFFYPRMLKAAFEQVNCRLEAVDSCGLIPITETPKDFATAYAFRRWLQSQLLQYWPEVADEDPLRGADIEKFSNELIENYKARWPGLEPEEALGVLGRLEINHSIKPVAGLAGGARQARDRLAGFLDRLGRYSGERNLPLGGATSGLSPYLHFGHISSLEVLLALLDREGWSPDKMADKATGKRQGFWGLSDSAEAFLDQLITWRELGFVFCHHRPDYGEFRGLPEWALKTLTGHGGDARPYLYDLEAFEAAQTHDPLWNAAMNQLKQEGIIHNYLRMLWGKKILHWSASPREAWEILIKLNNRYALDGRDPNSWSGIGWCLGRFDRAWGPEREVFGKVRFMTSRNTARKLFVKDFIVKYQ